MKKIIIMSSLGIGDVITAGPLLKKLKVVYPNSKILIYSLRGGYLENYNISYVDEIIKLRGLKNIIRFFREKSDIHINLGYYSKISSHFKTFLYYLMIFLSRSRKKIFLGDLESLEFKNKDMVQMKLGVLKKLNIEVRGNDCDLFVPFSFRIEKNKVNKLLRIKKIEKDSLLTIIHTGTKGGYFTRFWPSDRWVEIINYLNRNYQAKICFIGGKDDIETTDQIIKKIKFPIYNFVGKLSLQETTALIDKCNLFISTNSGPMWIAAALHKPQIALCGPSKTAWDPYNKNAIVIRKTINRKYCNPPCDAKKCKYKDNLCMESINVEEIKSGIKRQLKQHKP